MNNFNRDGSALAWAIITLVVLVIVGLRVSSHAAQIEVGAGIAQAQTQGNGTWYQDGFAHSLRLTQPVVEIGVTGRFTPHMDWHIDAISMGRYAVNSEDVGADANDSAMSPTHCNGPCLPLQNFIGSGRIDGVQALLAWHTRGAWQVGIQGGPFLYHETWRLDVPNWYPATTGMVPDWYTTRMQVGAYTIGQIIPLATYRSQWAIGTVMGITLTHGAWSLTLRRYSDGAGFGGHVGGWPPLWKGQTMLILGYQFGGVL